MSVLVGKQAPDFEAQGVNAEGSFEPVKLSALCGKYVVLFFYPLDFTFVCPSEIIAFDNHLAEFKERAVDVLGVSVDSHFTHHAWRETDRNKGGIGRIGYTLVADLTKQIARDYDVLTGDGAVAYRGLFLIDKQGKVRHQVVNDLPLGRSVEETLRMVDALQFHESHGEVCLANWSKGKAGMKANAEGVAAYLAENASKL
ncbi:MAG: peroxiredoxin [Planctomycetes bacterium]|nr:peroxiredoxin [Planctomycetota bacterium]MCB9904356.1 peroxiredoxin [Planctomycetota bacterium]